MVPFAAPPNGRVSRTHTSGAWSTRSLIPARICAYASPSVCRANSSHEQSSIPVDRDLLCGLLGSGGVVGPFDEFAVLELRAGADERHEMGRVDRPPA